MIIRDFVLIVYSIMILPDWFYQFRHQASPACLMTRSYTATAIAMKILVEENVIFEVRIFVQQFMTIVHGLYIRSGRSCRQKDGCPDS